MSCRAGLDLGCCPLGMGSRHFQICVKCQRHTHTALGKALGFANQAKVGVGHAQGFVHTVKYDALGLCAAVDHGADAGCFKRSVHRQTQNSAGAQLKLALQLPVSHAVGRADGKCNETTK